jgi:hypothetical protein
MRRRLAHFLFVTLVGALALVLGMVTSMTATSPGRGLLARLVADQLGRTLRGEFQFGAISGSFVRSLTLTDVTTFPNSSPGNSSCGASCCAIRRCTSPSDVRDG